MTERYKVIKEIGSGAQSIVYKVEDTKENNKMYTIYLILYSKSHFDSNKSKKRSNRKKRTPHEEITAFQTSWRVLSSDRSTSNSEVSRHLSMVLSRWLLFRGSTTSRSTCSRSRSKLNLKLRTASSRDAMLSSTST